MFLPVLAMPATRRLLSFFLLMLLFWNCGEEEKYISPTRQDIVESVYASATVQPEHLYKAFAAVTGILEANLVEEGQIVNAGTALLKVTNPAPEKNAENARLQMQMAKLNYAGENSILKDLATQIRTAELTFSDDSLNFKRQEKLWHQNIGSQSVYETKKLAYERSKNQMQAIRGEYRRTEIELRTKLEQAQNTYAASLATSGDFTVRSTLNGKVKWLCPMSLWPWWVAQIPFCLSY
jgi:multidrug efflux pump subunit AcrA (membrane-fusion protein)